MSIASDLIDYALVLFLRVNSVGFLFFLVFLFHFSTICFVLFFFRFVLFFSQQVPQLSTSRQIDINDNFYLINPSVSFYLDVSF